MEKLLVLHLQGAGAMMTHVVAIPASKRSMKISVSSLSGLKFFFFTLSRRHEMPLSIPDGSSFDWALCQITLRLFCLTKGRNTLLVISADMKPQKFPGALEQSNVIQKLSLIFQTACGLHLPRVGLPPPFDESLLRVLILEFLCFRMSLSSWTARCARRTPLPRARS